MRVASLLVDALSAPNYFPSDMLEGLFNELAHGWASPVAST
jgi:hypothetical protein